MQRRYSFIDNFCLSLDQALRTLNHHPASTGKPYPAENSDEPVLTEKHRQHAAGLMRVNHAGEICAQALYHGQACVSTSPFIKEKMQQAAIEEGDHLLWCQKRLNELNSHTSYLNPLWYAGSFLIGTFAGMIGDRWSLGFVAETERQVIKHLENHLQLLPVMDKRSYLVLQQMEKDEARHREDAIGAGAEELPSLIKKIMSLVSRIMVKTAYWV